jgi:hypothetical protein
LRILSSAQSNARRTNWILPENPACLRNRLDSGILGIADGETCFKRLARRVDFEPPTSWCRPAAAAYRYDVEMASHLKSDYRKFALKIIQHEMGHYISGRVLGFAFSGMSLLILGPKEGHRGEAGIQPAQLKMVSVDDVRSYLRRRVTVLYSGAPAETFPTDSSGAKVNGQQALNIIRTPGKGAEQDHAKARELIHLLRSLEHPDTDPVDDSQVQAQLDVIDLALWNDAVALVEAHAATIKTVAEKLVDRIRFPGEKIVLEPSDLDELPEIQSIRLR